jgi:hypothetical protein
LGEASGVQTPAEVAAASRASHHKRESLRGRHLGGIGVKRLFLLPSFGASQKKEVPPRKGVNENKKYSQAKPAVAIEAGNNKRQQTQNLKS